MRPFALQRCVCLALAAALLPGGMIPPGVSHAHADGDRPHRHAADHADCNQGHAHDEADHHGSPRQSHDHEESTLTEAIPHVHVNLFGIDLTLPISERDRHDSQEQESHGLELVAAGLDHPAIVGQSSHSPNKLILLPPAPPAAGGDTAGEQHRLVKSTEACSIPLCDSVRRERTGVFII